MVSFSFQENTTLKSKFPKSERARETPAFFDGDGDGKPEYLFRGFNSGLIEYFPNTGSAGNPSFSDPALFAETTFNLKLPNADQVPPGPPGSGDPDEGLTPSGDFSTPTFGDIDGDGDLDAVVGQYNSKGATLNPIGATVYTFTNTAAAPTDPPTFAAPEPVPVDPAQATYTAPALVDIDGDGDLELFVGIARFDNPGNSNIAFFENDVKDDGSREFVLADNKNPFNGRTFNAKNALTPIFVRRSDIDPDSDSDLYDAVVVVNNLRGSPSTTEIKYYENTGTKKEPVFTKELTGSDNPFAAINALNVPGNLKRYNPAIAFVDADGDANGLLDVLLSSGEQGSNKNLLSVWQNSKAVFPTPSSNFLNADTATNIFTVGGQGGSNLQLKLTGESANKITQVKLKFLDANNAVTEAYDLFSVLPSLFRPNGFTVGLEDFVFDAVTAGERFAIELQTIDGQTIGFGTNNLRITNLGAGQWQLAFEEGDDSSFDDFIFSIQQTTSGSPVGVGSNQREGLEVIDLSGVAGGQANFTVYREASYNNFVGFYRIDDASGSIGGLAPGQSGYARAAIENRVGGLELSVANQSISQFSASLSGNALYAPFIIADGDVSSFLNDNPDNLGGGASTAYFVFTAANPDGVDHVRLLGDNIFGFEDLPGGGDFDYNDIILDISLTA